MGGGWHGKNRTDGRSGPVEVAVEEAVFLLLEMALGMGAFGYLAYATRTGARQGGAMRMPRALGVSGLVGVVFGLGFTFLAWRDGQLDGFVLTVFGGFAAAGICLSLAGFRTSYRVDTFGLRGRSWRRRVDVRWSNVRRVQASNVWKWWVLETADDTVRISWMVSGQPQFARFLLERAEVAVFDGDAIPLLEQTRMGNPPDVFS